MDVTCLCVCTSEGVWLYVGKREERMFQVVGTAYMKTEEKHGVFGELKKGQCDWNLQIIAQYAPHHSLLLSNFLN